MNSKKVICLGICSCLLLANNPISAEDVEVIPQKENIVNFDITKLDDTAQLFDTTNGINTIINKPVYYRNITGAELNVAGTSFIEKECMTIAERERIKKEEEQKKLQKEMAEACKKNGDGNVPDGVEDPETGVACNSRNVTYMAYTAVTATSSPQYKLLNASYAYTDEETGIRMVDGRYCIALGSGYTSLIGEKVNLVMKDGSVIKCILGDQKADEHTDFTNRFQKYDGSVAEIIVDYDKFNGNVPSFFTKGIKMVVIMNDDGTINEEKTGLIDINASIKETIAKSEAEKKAKEEKKDDSSEKEKEEKKAEEDAKKAEEEEKKKQEEKKSQEQTQEVPVEQPTTEVTPPVEEVTTEAATEESTQAPQ